MASYSEDAKDINQGSQIVNKQKHLDRVFLPFITGGLYKYEIYFVRFVYGFYRKQLFPECEFGLNCKNILLAERNKMPARVNRPAYSFTADCSLHDFILGYMNVSSSSFPFGDAVGQFSALTP